MQSFRMFQKRLDKLHNFFDLFFIWKLMLPLAPVAMLACPKNAVGYAYIRPSREDVIRILFEEPNQLGEGRVPSNFNCWEKQFPELRMPSRRIRQARSLGRILRVSWRGMGRRAAAKIKIPQMMHTDADVDADIDANTHVSNHISTFITPTTTTTTSTRTNTSTTCTTTTRTATTTSTSNTTPNIKNDSRSCVVHQLVTTTSSDRRRTEPRRVP